MSALNVNHNRRRARNQNTELKEAKNPESSDKKIWMHKNQTFLTLLLYGLLL